jgi:hypothetical protein
MAAASFFPQTASVTFNNPGQIIVDVVLKADQIWANNLFYRTAFGAATSFVVFAIAVVGMGTTDKSYPQRTQSSAFRFFVGLAFLGGAGLALTFISCFYANYRFHKV